MVPLKLLLSTLTFYELIVTVDALRCPKGKRVVEVNRKPSHCEPCQSGTFQAAENPSKSCTPCTQCHEKSGSVTVQACTRERNTICQCRGEFVAMDRDSSTCKCDIGFEKIAPDCLKCKDGYFSTKINSICRKWKECTFGVKVPGNRTADHICKEPPKSDTHTTTPPTSNSVVSVTTRSTSHRPQEGAQTQEMHTTTTTTTTTTITSAPGLSSTTKTKPQPVHPMNTGIFIIFGMLILLLVLFVVTCKLHIVPMERQPGVPKNESLCRTPVEESGSGSLEPLKPEP